MELAIKNALAIITFALVACGRQDRRNYNCTVKGEECPEEQVPVEGPPGPQGPAGSNGTGCTVLATDNGAVIVCPDGTAVTIQNGTNGSDGADGALGTCTVHVHSPKGHKK